MVKLAFFILVLVLLPACATISDRPQLTTAEVIRIADAEARRHGYDLHCFDRPKPRYNFAQSDDTWWVNYEPKPSTPLAGQLGSDFSVHIEDKTKKVWLFPGR